MRWLFPALAAVLVFGCSTFSSTPTLSDAQQAIADLKFKESGLTITGAVEPAGSHFHVGDPVTLTVTVNRDASVAVLRVERNGVTTIVFPNKAQPDARVKAGTVLRIPAPGTFPTVIADRHGPELFKFIASTGDAEAWLFTKQPPPGADFVDLGSTSRAVAHEIRSALKGAAASAYLAIFVGG
jgi:hypothetical protein